MGEVSDDIEEMSVDVEEESQNTFLAPEPPEGMDVNSNLLTTFSWILDNWFLLLIIGVCSMYIYQRYIYPAIEKFRHTLADREMEAKLHKNPDLVRARQEALMEARRKMQEKHDAEAARMAELRKVREEKKKEEILSKNLEKYSSVGHTLNEADPRSQSGPSSRPNRTDYNPLMGSGSGGYRPQRRRPCSGGGCG
ncbi:hypothetical protein R5R35_008396 [Gryllus longicercus]|uniref:Selenoprotein S n=1 Tax=Gryllus longicercus TaxID=2509291 RepID=A0AAN9VZW3_9ORTH